MVEGKAFRYRSGRSRIGGQTSPPMMNVGFAVFPAFADVWASGLLADRMQASVCNLLADVGMIWTVTELRFDPGGLALDVSLRISDLKAQ